MANISFSISLKNTSREGWSLGGFHEDLGVNEGVSLNSQVGSLRKYYLRRILLQNSSKSFRSSGSFILLWIGAYSRPFSRTFISLSVKTFRVKLNIVSEQKYPESLFFSVALASLLLSIFSKSPKMESSSLSWVEKISVLLDSTNEQDEFWHSEELVHCIRY